MLIGSWRFGWVAKKIPPLIKAGGYLSRVYGFLVGLVGVGWWKIHLPSLSLLQSYHLSGFLYFGSFWLSILYQCNITGCALSSTINPSFIWFSSWYVILLGSNVFGYKHNLFILLWLIPVTLASSRCVTLFCFSVVCKWFILSPLFVCVLVVVFSVLAPKLLPGICMAQVLRIQLLFWLRCLYPGTLPGSSFLSCLGLWKKQFCGAGLRLQN